MTRNPEVHIDAAIAQGGKPPAPAQSRSPTADGNPQGLACSPRAQVPEVGYGVHAANGALVLGGSTQTDFALPGALPLIWLRRYNSHVDVAQGGFCGVLGHGWRTPLELRLEVKAGACMLHDIDGRSIHFDALPAGESHYSPSEDLWLLRSGGDAAQGPNWYASHEQRRFAHLPKDMVQRPHVIFAGHGNGDELWAFAPCNRKALEDGSATAPSDEWQLLGRIDRLGRIQRYRYGNVLGTTRLVAMQDGVGRCYRLHYEQVRTPRPEPRYPSGHFWQADSGVRLSKVELLGTPDCFNALDPELLVRYVYSAEGDLVEVRTGREEHVQRFAYRNHLLTLHQERGGPEHHCRYERSEPGARVIEQRSRQGLTHHFSYQTLPCDEDQQPRTKTLVTDSLKRSNGLVYKGAAGLARLAEHTRADGSTVRQAHDPHGRLISTTDTQGRTTHLWPDARGLVTVIQHPDDGETRNEWDAATGLLLSVTDPEGRTTRHHYDAWHRVQRIQRADASIERRAYPDPATQRLTAHLPSQITDGVGGVTRFVHSREGLLLSCSDPDGNTTQFEYSAKGQLLAQINALGETERYTYDERGQLIGRHLANGVNQDFQRDACGRIEEERVSGEATSEAALRNAGDVHFQYDLWGRITQREHAGTSVKWRYDDIGRLVEHINENGDSRHLHWDVMDRLVREIGFDQRTLEYRYGAGGRLFECVDGHAADKEREAHSIRYEWNDAGRLAAIRYPANADGAASVTRLEWNRADELLSAGHWLVHAASSPHTANDKDKTKEQLASRVEWRRDCMGRVIAESQQLFDAATGKLEFEHSIRHTLDGEGRRIASDLGKLGSIGYALNASGALKSLTWQRTKHIEWSRDALQRETSRHLTMAGVRRDVDWNSAGLWQTMEWSGDALPPTTTDIAASAIRARQYLYDHTGRVLAIHSDVGTSRFAYDAHGRLIASHTPQAGAQRWSFDPAGHRLPQPSDLMTAAHANDLEAESACDDEVTQAVVRRPESELAHTTRWAGGRVDYYTNAHDHCNDDARLCFCYDSRSNRTRVLDLQTGHSMRLRYDTANQLVVAKGVDGKGKPFEQHYRHDALGRCIAIHRIGEGAAMVGVDYFGWDGERLVHIERHATRAHAESTPDEIVHTIYEPGSCTPLLQLAKGDSVLVDRALPTSETKPSSTEKPQQHDMRRMLRNLGEIDARIKARLAVGSGKNANNQAFVVRQLKAAQSAQQQHSDAAADADTNDVQIRHVLTDHTGSPAALLSAKGRILWALQQDAWGNPCREHNPQHLWQPLRSEGRYFDACTGLLLDATGRCHDTRLGEHINSGPHRGCDVQSFLRSDFAQNRR